MSKESAEFESRHLTRFVENLGDGKDGLVLKSERGQAVKFFHDRDVYRRELRAYQILRERDIDEIKGFQVPRLIRSDDELRAIEMTIVQAPYLLDFAAAYTSTEYERLEFTQEVMEERETYWAEVFEERWPVVQELCSAFTRETGLILLDLSPNNIKF
jgi:hypothetical protein